MVVTVSLGLWCERVATKWDRSESVEFVTLNFAGFGPKWSALRIPIFALDKSFVASRHTYDDVMSLVYPGPAWLNNMTVRMIKPEGARAAKTKCYGAENRGLLPVVHHLVREMLRDDGVDGSSKVGTEHLSACYQCLSATTPFAADRLAEHCNRFAALYVALERATDGAFCTKPKLHMFQELCEMSLPGRPARSWTCRDDEFGGVLVGTARRREGQRTPSSTGNALLRKITARFEVPDLR